MKRQLFFGTLCAAALSVGISAQEPQPSSSTPRPQTPSSTAQQPSRAKQDVTLTGCLQSGSGASTTGTTGTAASGEKKSGSMSGGDFVLANAKMGGSSGSTATGTAGSPTGAASASASGADKYKLTGHESDLRKYANSQVEVKGTIESKGSSSATPSASASSASSEPTLHVSSVKQISPSCSGGN